MKKIFSFFLVALLAIVMAASLTACGDPENPANVGNETVGTDEDEGTEGLAYHPLPDGTYGVMAGTTMYLEEVVIPATYNGKAVTQILPDAFLNAVNLTRITIPNSVTTISKSAFSGCSSLDGVIIPSSVCGLGDYAFKDCTSLTSVTIGNGVTSIGNRAFYSCTSLTSVTIPDGVTSIGDSAFYGCTGLTSVTIPDSVTSIGNSAFEWCYKLVEVINNSSLDIEAGSLSNGKVGFYAKEVHKCEGKIANYNDYLFYTYDGVNYLLGYVGEDTALVLPESYNGKNYEIYKYAFYERDDITSVVIPDSVCGLGNSAFEDCMSLTSVTIGNGVTNIVSFAFGDCTSLTSVTIGNSVKSISSYAFRGCTGLTSVTIPDSVTLISFSAFEGCSGLTSVTIPDSVTSIGERAFHYCTGLKTINYTGSSSQWSSISKGSYWNYNTGSYTINYDYKN